MPNKICPNCGHEMQLIGLGLMVTLHQWVCTNCIKIIDYSSEEASKLKESKK